MLANLENLYWPLQCSCLENPRDGVAQSQTQLKWLSSITGLENVSFYSNPKERQLPKNVQTTPQLHSSHMLAKERKESEVAQLYLTLCNPMDCSLPGSSVHGIFQARILECVAISFSRRFSWSKDWTRVSCIVGRHFTIWATREAQ